MFVFPFLFESQLHLPHLPLEEGPQGTRLAHIVSTKVGTLVWGCQLGGRASPIQQLKGERRNQNPPMLSHNFNLGMSRLWIEEWNEDWPS